MEGLEDSGEEEEEESLRFRCNYAMQDIWGW